MLATGRSGSNKELFHRPCIGYTPMHTCQDVKKPKSSKHNITILKRIVSHLSQISRKLKTNLRTKANTITTSTENKETKNLHENPKKKKSQERPV
jgi:hypothetical protein